MTKIINVKFFYILTLTFLLLLSFNPTESGESFFSLYLRLMPFVLFLLLIIFSNLDVKFSLIGLIVTVFLCIYLAVINISEPSKRLTLQLVSVVLMFIVASIISNNDDEKENFNLVLSSLIIIWVTLLVTQVLSYYILDVVINVHSIVFPLSEARGLSVGNMRFGGLQIEPGTYSNWIFGVVVLRSFLIRRISTPLHWLAVGSMLLTLSFWAYISVVFFIIAASLEKKRIEQIKLFSIVMLLIIIVYFLAGDYLASFLLNRSQLNTPTATGKLEVYSYMLSHYQEWLLLGSSLKSKPCDACSSWQDAGVGVNLMFYFGLLMIFIYIKLILNSVRYLGFKVIFLIIPIFIAKYYYWDPITVMLVVFILVYPIGFKKTLP